MTTVTVDAIRAQAAKIDPVKVLIALLTFPFAVIGFTLRMVWLPVSLGLAAFMVGWQAAGTTVEARTPTKAG